MKGFSKLFHNFELAFAICSVVLFTVWWFNPANIPNNFSGLNRIFDFLLFFLVSYIIWHPILMDMLTWLLSSHITQHKHRTPQPGLKVAFITTIVPASESINLLHKCLPAMVKASYKHDTWLLDEGGSSTVKAICDLYGVKYFSRYGKGQYNTRRGRFAKKTKGGNHNAWYDAFGKDYDIVAQIDTDFIPTENFLTDTLGFFRDPKVAFVGTPQIYGNVKESFVALGAAEQQYYFYGTVLQGLNGMETTFLIGANHVIRVAALRDVGFYSAHLTEDLLTGMKLHAKKWKSVYLPKKLAVGDGPATWEAYFNQQARWAYGCMDILFHHSFKLFRQMGLRRAIYYFFLQQHYFSGISMGLSIILLSLYFFTGIQTASVDAVRFAMFYSFIMLICWIVSVRLQRFHIRSQNATELQIAGKIISIASWPIYFLAFLSVLLGKRMTYKVTPKGQKTPPVTANLRLFAPHIVFGVLALLCLASSFLTQRQNSIMMFWSFSCAFLMLSIPFSQQLAERFSPVNLKRATLVRPLLHFFQESRSSDHTSFTIKPLNVVSEKSSVTQNRNKTLDMFFLSFVVIASILPYIRKIGFYSDDWSFLANFSLAQDRTIVGLLQVATTPNTFMRPVQNLYDVLLYLFFGTNPLGYQIVNLLVLLSITLLFHTVLRQLRLPRIIALVLPLVYILMPHFTTDRFWYAAYQVNISMLLYFMSLASGLQALSRRTTYSMILKTTSIITMLLSILSYEVVFPLYIINLVLFWYSGKNNKKFFSRKIIQPNNKSAFILLTSFALIYSVLFKLMTTTRITGSQSASSYYPEHILYVLSSAFKVNFVTLGISLPRVWWNMASAANTQMLIAGSVLGIGIFSYLLVVALKKKNHFPTEKWLAAMMIIGPILFIFGYAIFFTNDNIGFSPTGLANRVAIAAAIGVVVTFIGAIGFACRLIFSEKIFRVLFCLLISVACAGGFLYINTVASYWADAYKQEKAIVSDIQNHFPKMKKNTTLILDGVCRYTGPAPVFEAYWDLKGALQIEYKDPTIKADIVTSRLKITDTGLVTTIYTTETTYPYKDIVIYNQKTKKSYKIKNTEEAKQYFQEHNPQYKTACSGEEGHGVSIL